MDRELADLGCRTFEAVLDRAECLDLAVAVDSLPHSRAGARHLLSNARISALARDERLVAIARDCLGGDAFPFRVTLFAKSPAANWLVVWHQDTALPFRERFDEPGWGPWSIKGGVHYTHGPAWALSRVVALRVHLDPSTEENGALSFVASSHTLGVLNDAEISTVVRERTPGRSLLGAGGVFAMRPLLLHSSGKSRGDDSRRVIHIEYADAPSLGPGRDLAVC